MFVFRHVILVARHVFNKNIGRIRSFFISISPITQLLAFLEIGSFKFSDFWHKGAWLKTLECDGAWFSKKIFGQIWAKKRLKNGFFGLCEKLDHFFSDFLHESRVSSYVNDGLSRFSQKFFLAQKTHLYL